LQAVWQGQGTVAIRTAKNSKKWWTINKQQGMFWQINGQPFSFYRQQYFRSAQQRARKR
jgi:hypothetical protein